MTRLLCEGPRATQFGCWGAGMEAACKLLRDNRVGLGSVAGAEDELDFEFLASYNNSSFMALHNAAQEKAALDPLPVCSLPIPPASQPASQPASLNGSAHPHPDAEVRSSAAERHLSEVMPHQMSRGPRPRGCETFSRGADDSAAEPAREFWAARRPLQTRCTPQ